MKPRVSRTQSIEEETSPEEKGASARRKGVHTGQKKKQQNTRKA